MRFLLIVASVFLLSPTALAQKKDRFPSYFGFQFKPLIPGDFLAKSQITVSNGTFSGVFTQKYGYSFGAMTRIGITKLISFETGINQVKRNYDIDFAYPDSSLYGSADFGVISYDIPINAMIYIQLSEKFFTNASLGTSFVYYPSNVGVILPVNNKVAFTGEGKRNRLFDFEINANFGFELRSEKNGFFYLGASAKLPLAPIFKVAAAYEFPGNTPVAAVGEVNGAYLSLDLRYFFPNVKNKGKNTTEGPITN
ncbi:MAG: hypothetical protein K0R65_1801 [Crocinitomicaceae bacterium]|jgi:hypothetical protein|nr:hypothetical protein [Crocinitomicaceae bacterium]